MSAASGSRTIGKWSIEEDGDIISTVYEDIEMSFGPKCPKTGRREFFFGRPGAVCDTSCPVGANPLKTLRAVRRFLIQTGIPVWWTGGDARLDKFYKVVGTTFN